MHNIFYFYIYLYVSLVEYSSLLWCLKIVIFLNRSFKIFMRWILWISFLRHLNKAIACFHGMDGHIFRIQREYYRWNNIYKYWIAILSTLINPLVVFGDTRFDGPLWWKGSSHLSPKRTGVAKKSHSTAMLVKISHWLQEQRCKTLWKQNGKTNMLSSVSALFPLNFITTKYNRKWYFHRVHILLLFWMIVLRYMMMDNNSYRLQLQKLIADRTSRNRR